MHEYSVGLALMDRIEVEASARGATAVHRVRLSIGEVSGIEPDLLASAFEILRERTICEHAVLDITAYPGPVGLPDVRDTHSVRQRVALPGVWRSRPSRGR